ncbi:hypothetical protein QOZ80_3BG0288970 [Eleusine coracana subsp. coracana]|nr:hypothetical protein QOZ80_3BG0288970 [Eleusine coracana subsp. coracana]
MASASPSWVILDVAPRLSTAAADGEPQPGSAISLALAAPPRITKLDVGPGVFPADPDTQARVSRPFILATDPSGLLLAIAPPSMSERAPEEERVWRGPDGVERTIRVGHISPPAYLVLDLPSGAASRVPDPDVLNASSLGVIAGRGGFMVVGFQNMVGSRNANLICFLSETREWVVKKVDNPEPRWIWTFCDVISHDGKLWWVDRAAGLLVCNPFADKPEMAYVPLVRADDDDDDTDEPHRGCGYCSQRMAASGRYVKLSGGKIRCVEMTCGSKGGAPKFSMGTLATVPPTVMWDLHYKVSFDEIWADDSYKATGLPEKAPEFALVHPKNPDVIYFFLEEHIFGVDMPARKVVECAPHELDVPASKGGPSSSCVLAWELPPTMTAGLLEEALDNGVN